MVLDHGASSAPLLLLEVVGLLFSAAETVVSAAERVVTDGIGEMGEGIGDNCLRQLLRVVTEEVEERRILGFLWFLVMVVLVPGMR